MLEQIEKDPPMTYIKVFRWPSLRKKRKVRLYERHSFIVQRIGWTAAALYFLVRIDDCWKRRGKIPNYRKVASSNKSRLEGMETFHGQWHLVDTTACFLESDLMEILRRGSKGMSGGATSKLWPLPCSVLPLLTFLCCPSLLCTAPPAFCLLPLLTFLCCPSWESP